MGLATLGDKLMSAGNSNWRADLRAAGVPTRLPPPSERSPTAREQRPDRGYVEQPEERVTKSEAPETPRRRVVITTEQLLRYSEPQPQMETPPSVLDTFPIHLTEPTSALPAAPVAAAPALTATSESEQPLSTQREPKRRVQYPAEFKLAAVARVEQGETQTQVARSLGVSKSIVSLWCVGQCMSRQTAMNERTDDQREKEDDTPMVRKWEPEFRAAAVARVLKGETAGDVSRELGIPGNNLWNWLAAHKQKHGNRIPKGHENAGPASGARPRNGQSTMVSPSSQAFGDLPPEPTLRIEGLKEYIDALIDRRVAQAVKAEIQKRFAGD